MRGFGWSLMIGTLLLGSGCTAPTAVSDGTLSVRRVIGALELENASAAAMHYFAVERGAAARIQWIACAGPACPAVPGRATARVADSLIVGYFPAASEAIVYWWPSVADGQGGWRADSIRAVVAPLR